MSYKKHAIQEFKAAGWLDENGKYCDEIQELICTQILELLGKFDEHGHGGSSAPYAVNIFKKLTMFEPITPVTGADWEWQDVDGKGTFQNTRCSHVFKGPDGRAYDIDGYVFREKSGACFTNKDSRRYVEFPYTPKTEYIDV